MLVPNFKNPFLAVASAVQFPRFVADLLGSVYNANLDVQSMNQMGIKLKSAGFAPLGQVIAHSQAGDVALTSHRVAVYDGKAWLGLETPLGIRPPYRVYRRHRA